MAELKNSQHLKMSLREIEIATNKFETCIGKGGFGAVFKGQLSLAGELVTVAVKRLDESITGQGLKEFLTEIQFLSVYKHQNLIHLIGFCEEGDEKILVYEYAENGSLDQYLSNDTQRLSWMQRLEICVGAARGLEYLHNRVGKHHRVIHRDIKSANILLGANCEAKISDLGLSKVGLANGNNSFVISNACGSLGYCDPIYVGTGILTKESDVYSFGVVLFEVLSGRLCLINTTDEQRLLIPWVRRCFQNKKMEEVIDSSLRNETDSNSMKKFVTIAYQCLLMERERRPSMSLVVKQLEKALEIERKRIMSLQTRHVMYDMPRSYEGGLLMDKAKRTLGFLGKIFGSPKIIEASHPHTTEAVQYPVTESTSSDTQAWQAVTAISMYELKTITKNFKTLIGVGSNGGVYHGRMRNGQVVAIKKLLHFSRYFGEKVLRTSELRDDNVIKLLGYCFDSDTTILVYEYATNGSLHDILHGQKHVKGVMPSLILSWSQRVKIAAGAAKGLQYLHERAEPHIMHGGITSKHILLFDNDVAKIKPLDSADSAIESDFNYRDTRIFNSSSLRSLHPYKAPEYIENGVKSKESDVYSFGVVLLELLTGRRPLDHSLPPGQQNLVIWATPKLGKKKVFEYVDPELNGQYRRKSISEMAAVAGLCLQHEAKYRPNINIVVKALQQLLTTLPSQATCS